MSNINKKRTFSEFENIHYDEQSQPTDSSNPLSKKQKLNPERQILELPTPTNSNPTLSTSPSIEILSVHIPTHTPIKIKQLKLDNKENDGDIHNNLQTDTNTNTHTNTAASTLTIPIPTLPSTNSNTEIEMTDTDTNHSPLTNTDWTNDCEITQHRLQSEWYHFKIQSKHNSATHAWLKHEQLKHLQIYKSYLKQSQLSIEEVTEPQYTIEEILDHEYNEELKETEFFVKWKGYENKEDNTWEPHSSLQNNVLYIQYCKANNLHMDRTVSDSDNDSYDSEEYEEITVDSEIECGEFEEFERKEYKDEYDGIDIAMNESVAGIDIESEYISAKGKLKEFSIEYCNEIVHEIDEKTQELFEVNVCPNSKNTNNSNGKSLEERAERYMNLRQYFETLKNKKMFEQFQKMEKKENMRASMGNVAMDLDDSDSVEIIAVKTPKKMTKNNKNKRKTLFDYSFTPAKTPQPSDRRLRSHTKNNKNKNENASNNNAVTISEKKSKLKTNAKSQSKKPTLKPMNLDTFLFGANHSNNSSHTQSINNEENGEIKMGDLKQVSTCYGCKRKWNLCFVEYFKAFPVCNNCPTQIRLGHNRKLREDWFCPYCHHSAKCVLFPSLTQSNDSANDRAFGTNGTLLSRIANSEHKPYLYIKPNNSNYWKTYVIVSVTDEVKGEIVVRGKRGKKRISLALSEIPMANILWAYHYHSDKKRYFKDDIASISNFTDAHVWLKTSKKAPLIQVEVSQVITNDKYLNKLSVKRFRQCLDKTKKDRAKIFKYSRHLKEERRAKELKKNKFGKNTMIEETAPINSRYFEANTSDTNESEMAEIVPNHKEVTAQLLSFCNLSSIPQNLLTPPKRELQLENIEKYSLTLVVGPSGSGKSTLLRSLQAQNPQQITFKSPDDLLWHQNKSVISELGNVDIETAMDCMSSIGLNNIRTWLKPFHILSAGEQYRCGFARLLLQSANEQNTKLIIMDEFTSVLDRTNARCMSAATSKCIRKNKKKYKNNANFVLASANADIIRYLQPDLLILLGENNGMKLIENPNDLQNSKNGLFDVKTILDLPPFKKKRGKQELLSANEFQSVSKLTVFDDLKPYNRPVTIDKHVRELKCRVEMDSHATQTSTILDVEDFNGECVTHIPCLQQRHIRNNDFNIGIIVGPSGSGKTTTAERLFGKPKPIEWDNDRDIASHFTSLQRIKELFCAVDLPLCIGFSRFEHLSEGEQHRADIARYLDKGSHVLIDEFTSYLDRITAKKVAKGVSDYIYRNNLKNIVFLACKYDIISCRNGMSPSWIFDVQNKKMTHYKPSIDLSGDDIDSKIKLYAKHAFIDISHLWNPPKIRLVLRKCTKYDFSPTFSRYHYMDASISCSAKCYSVWAYFSYQSNDSSDESLGQNTNKKRSDKEEASDSDEMEQEILERSDDGYYNEDELELVGFISVLNHYGSNTLQLADGSKRQMDFREHRTVVLPSFQGLGFGSRIADTMGEYLALHGYRLHSKTAHPRYGGYRNRQPSLWMATKANGQRTARKAWKKDLERLMYGSKLKDVGKTKKYFIHVFKLHNERERTKEVNDLLRKRVIVKRSYKMVQK